MSVIVNNGHKFLGTLLGRQESIVDIKGQDIFRVFWESTERDISISSSLIHQPVQIDSLSHVEQGR
jgi:hypothetical protein